MRTLEIAGLKAGTVNRIINIVKSCFSKAIEWQIYPRRESPAKYIAELHDPALKERFLSQDEAKRLLEAVRHSRNPMLFPIIGFLLMTGARKSEVLHARWEHIDLERKAWLIPLSKSGKPRYVALSPSAIAYLVEAQTIFIAHQPQAEPSPFIFANPKTGGVFKNIFNSWNTARLEAGLEDVRLHDLRHSFASALVNKGYNLYDVKELLGHQSIKTTQRYAHLSKERLSEGAVMVAEHFGEL